MKFNYSEITKDLTGFSRIEIAKKQWKTQVLNSIKPKIISEEYNYEKKSK